MLKFFGHVQPPLSVIFIWSIPSVSSWYMPTLGPWLVWVHTSFFLCFNFNVFIWSFHIYLINFKEKTNKTAKCLTLLGLMSLSLAVSLEFICEVYSNLSHTRPLGHHGWVLFTVDTIWNIGETGDINSHMDLSRESNIYFTIRTCLRSCVSRQSQIEGLAYLI